MKLREQLLDLPPEVMLDVMMDAIGVMQRHNGQATSACIVEAMGGTTRELDDGQLVCTAPPSAEITAANCRSRPNAA